MTIDTELEPRLRLAVPPSPDGIYEFVELDREHAQGLAQFYENPTLRRFLGMNVRLLVDRIEGGLLERTGKYAVYLAEIEGNPTEAILFERVPGPAPPHP